MSLGDLDGDGRPDVAFANRSYGTISIFRNLMPLAQLLGRWRFDNTNTWVGDQGQLPLATTNVVGVPSWNTNAVLIDSPNAAFLTYRDVETNGNANMQPAQRHSPVLVQARLSSGSAGGSGPETPGRLIELGW